MAFPTGPKIARHGNRRKSKSPAPGEARRVPTFRATDSSEPYCPARKLRGSGRFCPYECRPGEKRVRTGEPCLVFTVLFTLNVAVG